MFRSRCVEAHRRTFHGVRIIGVSKPTWHTVTYILGMDDDVILVDHVQDAMSQILLPKLRSLLETARCNDAGS